MPTASQFDAAARALDEHAARLAVLLQPVEAAMGPAVLRGGCLTAAVESAVVHGRAVAGSVHDHLAQLADEARSRAEVCRQAWAAAVAYDAARRSHVVEMGAWRDGGEVGPPPALPRRPPTPPPWVEL